MMQNILKISIRHALIWNELSTYNLNIKYIKYIFTKSYLSYM